LTITEKVLTKTILSVIALLTIPDQQILHNLADN